jgi:hypothetical protein
MAAVKGPRRRGRGAGADLGGARRTKCWRTEGAAGAGAEGGGEGAVGPMAAAGHDAPAAEARAVAVSSP